jgi:hypothetical protein
MTLLTTMWITWGAAGGSGILSLVLVVLAARDLCLAQDVLGEVTRATYGN